MTAVESHRVEAFAGELSLPGDKSISHRALITGASAGGETRIFGLLEGRDVIATANALRFLGVVIEKNFEKNGGIWISHVSL